MNATLQTVWNDHESLVMERVALLEGAVAQLIAGELAEREREQARRAAHMLAGSVGMFGYERSSEAALALEAVFEPIPTPAAPLDPAKAHELRAQLAKMRAEGLEPPRA
jgi:chemotaxis protein histidine kinase CheA